MMVLLPNVPPCSDRCHANLHAKPADLKASTLQKTAPYRIRLINKSTEYGPSAALLSACSPPFCTFGDQRCLARVQSQHNGQARHPWKKSRISILHATRILCLSSSSQLLLCQKRIHFSLESANESSPESSLQRQVAAKSF